MRESRILCEFAFILARAELRRKVLWVEINGVTGGKDFPSLPKEGRGHTQFASELSEVTGESKRGVNAKIARADKLGPDINRIVGTSLDSGVEMDALAKMPGPERQALVSRAAAGERVCARPEPTDEKRKAQQRQRKAF
jgi:hypothetical protein